MQMQVVGARTPDAADRTTTFCDDDATDVESCSASVLSTPANEKRAWIQRSVETGCDDGESNGWSVKGKELGECEAQQDATCARGNTKTRFWCKRWKTRSKRDVALLLLAVLICLGTVFALSYLTLLGALLDRLTLTTPNSGLHHLARTWREPTARGPSPFPFPPDFSTSIAPKACHSHNDYWRPAPLYSALAAGCTGIEADIWLKHDGDLYVAHDWRWIAEFRTLRNLYLEPLYRIFEERNVSMASVGSKEVGVWDADPEQEVTLLIDFKNDGRMNTGEAIWSVLMEQLRVFQTRNWLSYWNGSVVVPGPLTVVATGHVSFELIQAQEEMQRVVFFDAPLNDIENPMYNVSNSFYASASLKKAVGIPWFAKLSSGQVEKIREQVNVAREKRLLSRYWGTPSWPISARNRIWTILKDAGVGMLNVDDLEGATRWNWDWCTVAGLNVCG